MMFTSHAKEKISPGYGNTGNTLTFAITSKPESAKLVRNAVDRFLAKRYPRSDASRELLIAVGEAVANAIEHGASTKDIIIKVVLCGQKVEIVVEDQGLGFDSLQPTAAALPPFESERGRGFPIIASCTDSLRIDTQPGNGTRLTFSRRLC